LGAIHLTETKLMSDKYFLDSNICVYLLELGTQKQTIAQQLITQSIPIISTQVIAENINVLTRKLGYSKEDAFQHAENLMVICTLAVITEQILKKSFLVSLRYGYRYFDSLIIATALENQCSILYSEDMHHSQVIDNQLTIINPFLP
jgi:predicted nucleic acid-binding protein